MNKNGWDRTSDNRVPNDGCWARRNAARHEECADIELLECAINTAFPAKLLIELDGVEVCLVYRRVL